MALPPQFQPVAPPAAYVPARARPAARRRVFSWVFLALQVLGLIFTLTNIGSGPGLDCTGDCAAAAQTSQGNNLLQGIEFWAGLDVIVFASWAAWKLDRRP